MTRELLPAGPKQSITDGSGSSYLILEKRSPLTWRLLPAPPTLCLVKEYYDACAAEYDDWYLGRGRFDGLERSHWDDELRGVERVIASLSPARTLDIGCGTGFLTKHLRGEVAGLDQSKRMLDIARERLPSARFMRGDALHLPFSDGSFERVFTGHFYGHLQEPERGRFLAEARRVARDLVVVDAAVRADQRPVQPRQQRMLGDGSRWEVFKRYFTGAQLAEELGGGEILLDGRWFVIVVSRRAD